jgi:UV DNA damage endonuclease
MWLVLAWPCFYQVILSLGKNAIMKIGYSCINNSIPRNAPSTFRLASYSDNRLVQTLKRNLKHLNQILKYNVKALLY